MTTRLLTTLLATLASACASVPMPPPGPRFGGYDEGLRHAAVVYVYRNSHTLALGGPTRILVNGEEVARLGNRGYTRLTLRPACYQLSQDWPTQGDLDARPLELCVAAGAVETVRVRPDLGSYRVTVVGDMILDSGQLRAFLEPVSRIEAMGPDPITDCRYYPPLDVSADGTAGTGNSAPMPARLPDH